MGAAKTDYTRTHVFLWESGGEKEKAYTAVNFSPKAVHVDHMTGKWNRPHFTHCNSIPLDSYPT